MLDYKDKWVVGEWMSRGLQTVPPETSVRQAFFTMRLEGIRHLLVTNNERKLLGILSDRDLRRPDVTDDPDGWDEFYNLDSSYEVQDIMSRDVKTLRPKDSLEKAVKMMLEFKFNAIPVLDKNNDVLGILSSYDLHSAFQRMMELSRENKLKI